MKHKIISAICFIIAIAIQIYLPVAVNAAYLDRGYFAIGGEWALPLLTMLCTYFGICELTHK